MGQARKWDKMSPSVVWFRFYNANEELWTVFLATRKACKWLRKDKHGGPYAGRTWWKRRRIYIETEQSPAELFDTIIHELTHVAIRPLYLPPAMDEEIVRSVAEGLWPIFGSATIEFPPLPEPIASDFRLALAAKEKR